MSYIPKYILKRMLPKDCLVGTDDGVKINLLNVISPISIDEIPDNVIDYIDVMVDGESVGQDILKGLKITFEDLTVGIDNIADALGKTVPVGGSLVIAVPKKLEKGKEYEIEVIIKADNPIYIKVKRTVQ